MDQNWKLDPTDSGPYAPSCSSRAAEGVYSGALLGLVWGVVGRASSTAILPTFRPTKHGNEGSPSPTTSSAGALGHEKRGFQGDLRAFGRGVAGYVGSAASTATVFGVFVGVLHLGTCTCEKQRGVKDWKNNCAGGAAAGLAVALLSKHTRGPRMLAAHTAGAAAITSLVAILSQSPEGGGGF